VLYLIFFCLLGLAVGSFLNVVIYRLPLMDLAEEKAAIGEWLKDHKISFKDPLKHLKPGPDLTLSLPRSACPNCGHVLKSYENIPLLSFLLQKGKCRGCSHKISVRYPLIELLTSVLFLLAYVEFGLSWQTLAAALFSCLVISLSAIDFDQQILPDSLNYLLLWCGLAASLIPLFTSPSDAILGAILGYGVLWSLYQIHHRLTGRIGMGYGDFKLLAALGAWVGWQQLPILALLASLFGILAFASNKAAGKDFQQIPFGPFLGAGGFVCLLYGAEIQIYLKQLIRL